MLTIVFPGQGSQRKGMGGSLFDEFSAVTEKADDILGYSIKGLCIDDPNHRLARTEYTQSALFVVNALSYMRRIEEGGMAPDYLAGHSLGEYNALLAAGAIDFETGVRLVHKRGSLMAAAKNGHMAAIQGLPGEVVRGMLAEHGLDSIDIANYNTPSQTVISGPRQDIERARALFERNGAPLVIPLNVSGAFHSRYMAEAASAFQEYLMSIDFQEPRIPVISNLLARPYTKVEMRRTLADQMTHPVKWLHTVRHLMAQGEMSFEEVGPGRVLTRLIKEIQTAEAPGPGEAPDETDSRTEPASRAPSAGTLPTGPRGYDSPAISAVSLGSADFKRDYKVRLAYAAGGMYRGISSTELVIRMAKSGLLGYFGTGGLDLRQIEDAIVAIQRELRNGEPYGMNFLCQPEYPEKEDALIALYQAYNVTNIEASAFMQITPALVRFRASGLRRGEDGGILITNRILAKLSRPEVAEAFLRAAPAGILRKLVDDHRITEEQADLAARSPMADDVCVEADSGGHTDRGVLSTLLPTIARLRDDMQKQCGYAHKVRIGAAGGIGTPEAAAAAFVLGADFILTGSINQCTVEAGTSYQVKNLLEKMSVQDTEYAAAGDMFEMGAKVQVLGRGVLFAARANKLYELYRRCGSLGEIDERTRLKIQDQYFHRSFDDVYAEVKSAFAQTDPLQIEKAERNPKHKMALIFRWYFKYSTDLAIAGDERRKVDYQICCGPALGAFNQWVQGTELEPWKHRHVDEIADTIMEGTAQFLSRRLAALTAPG